MRKLGIVLVLLLLISFHGYAKDGRNLTLKESGDAGKRVALVIGNGNYQHSDSLPKLSNPTHDAEDIAKVLRGFGFEVIERKDQSLEGMNSAIAEFSRKIGGSEAALFYFAGHGLQVKGQNYLIPVNANIETEARVQYESINVNLILDEMDNGKSRANIVMLDACRNNPISGKFRSGGTRGLAPITSQPKGTVIVYATDPGNVAADGDGRNGLFTAGLLTAFKGVDLSLGGVLTRASEEVERGSEQKQTPYINGPATLQKNFRFAPDQTTQIQGQKPTTTQAQTTIQPPPAAIDIAALEMEAWNIAKEMNTEDAYQAYLSSYADGRHARFAQAAIKKLKGNTMLSSPLPVTAPAQAAFSNSANTNNLFNHKDKDGETALWNAVRKGNNKDDYDTYLAQYPKGKYTSLAKNYIKKFHDEADAEASRKEQAAWESADNDGREDGYQDYLKSWPDGRYAILARVRLQKLQPDPATQQKQRLWLQAQSGENSQALKSYLDKYPDDNHAATAREMLAALRNREAENSKDKVEKSKAKAENYRMVNVGLFSATKRGEKIILCRGLPLIRTPNGKTFSEYIHQEFLDELKAANVYSGDALNTLTGNLDAIDVNTFSGVWNLTLTVNSTNGKSLTIAENYTYETSFGDGDIACKQAVRAFKLAVKDLVGKVRMSPEFSALGDQ